MKKTGKIFSVVIAIALVFAMAIPAMAVDITIDGDSANSAYSAWRILDAQDLGANAFKYTLNSKYTAALQEVTGKTAEADIVAYIEGLTDADAVRDFADAVYAKVKGMAADATATDSVFAGVAQGYYLIAETEAGDAADTLSLVMLDTAGKDNITVETKEGIPTVVKKVKDTNDTTGVTSDWQDSADYDIGDEIPFQVTGTVSAKIADYAIYEYIFHDEMDAGLAYKADSVKVMIGEDDVTDSFTTTYENDKLTVSCVDLKKIADVTVDADTAVVLTYTATLEADAVIGEAGNKNSVYLEYTNDPYYDGTGTPGEGEEPEDKTGETTKDTVVVFTYTLTVDKVDDDGNALKGAGFTLYKKVGGVETAIGEEIVGEALTTFTWAGLDDGTYVLKETTVPAGYNKAEDIEFTITATHDEDSAAPALTALSAGEKLSADKATGIIAADVINVKGNLLPTTGGIGTTIFYVVGALLVVGAVVLLITKRRMSAEA